MQYKDGTKSAKETKQEREVWMKDNPECIVFIDTLEYEKAESHIDSVRTQGFFFTKRPNTWIQACIDFYNCQPSDQQHCKQFHIPHPSVPGKCYVSIYIYQNGKVHVQGAEASVWGDNDFFQILRKVCNANFRSNSHEPTDSPSVPKSMPKPKQANEKFHSKHPGEQTTHSQMGPVLRSSSKNQSVPSSSIDRDGSTEDTKSNTSVNKHKVNPNNR